MPSNLTLHLTVNEFEIQEENKLVVKQNRQLKPDYLRENYECVD